MLRILQGDMCVGVHLWYVQGNIAYSHLMALSDAGYALNASYGLYAEAIRIFREPGAYGVRWLNIGAGAGTATAATDGLTQFKRGWATTTRMGYFCGRVLDRARYEAISREREVANTQYFPAYRAGEFG